MSRPVAEILEALEKAHAELAYAIDSLEQDVEDTNCTCGRYYNGSPHFHECPARWEQR